MKYIISTFLLFISVTSFAEVTCRGVINDIYKYDHFETISIRIDLDNAGLSKWVSLPTKSDESMALLAFAANKPVRLYFSDGLITNCEGGWDNNIPLKGYFLVGNN